MAVAEGRPTLGIPSNEEDPQGERTCGKFRVEADGCHLPKLGQFTLDHKSFLVSDWLKRDTWPSQPLSFAAAGSGLERARRSSRTASCSAGESANGPLLASRLFLSQRVSFCWGVGWSGWLGSYGWSGSYGWPGSFCWLCEAGPDCMPI